MNKKWEMVKLGEVCTKGSSSIAQRELENDNGKYPIYGASGFIKNVSFYKQSREYLAVVKDGAGIGRVMLLPAFSSVIGTLQYILSKDTVNNNYLFYALDFMSLEKYFSGATIPHIYFKDYQNEMLPLPPLEEQKKIAQELDKLQSIIQMRKEQIEKMDLLVKAKFVEMFGVDKFSSSPLDDVCIKITDGTHQSPKFVTEGIPFLLVSNIIDYKISYKTQKFIAIEEYEILIKRTPIEIGDVLLTTVGSYGNPAIVESDRKFCFQRHIGYLKPKKELIVSQYLKHFFLSPFGKEQIEFRVKGVAQKTLNLSELKLIEVPLPPIELQNQFADYVQKVEKIKSTMHAGLEKIEFLYNSRMQEYFG